MTHSISFQYLERGWEVPRAGYEITDQGIDLPEGTPVPRIGEFVQLVKLDSCESYVVLAVHTRILMLSDQAPGFHSVLTVGPASEVEDPRLLVIRE
jgi:hypothetical protein